MLLAIAVIFSTLALTAHRPAPVRYHVVLNPGDGAALRIELMQRGADGWRLAAMTDQYLIFIEP
jgi:hypothetical protein